MREIGKLILVLTVVCGVSAGSLTMARYTLEPRIERQSDLFLRGPALERLLAKPGGEILDNKILFQVDEPVFPIFFSVDQDHLSLLAVEAVGHGGYGGDIQLMFGIKSDGAELLGVEIIRHSETPGVGSRIETPSFRSQWEGLTLDEPVRLKTQGGTIDGLSGATYSTNTVVDGTNRVLDLVHEHWDEIVAQAEEKIRRDREAGRESEDLQ